MLQSAAIMCSAVMLVGCTETGPGEKKVPTQPEQKIMAPPEADQQRLREQRVVIERLIQNEDAQQKYKTAVGKLGTIRAVLQAKMFAREQTYELQCLGVILGDAFVQHMGMHWVIVEEEGKRTPAVELPGTSIILYPLTMISKRIERGEDVDVFELFNGLADQVEELRKEGV